jgi:hypothetical protein
MRIPIAAALFWPQRPPRAPSRLTPSGLALDFSRPEAADWPCLAAALCAGHAGGLEPAVVSAADETLVAAYLKGRLEFGQLGEGLWATLDAYRRSEGLRAAAEDGRHAGQRDPCGLAGGDAVAAVLQADLWARRYACVWAESHCPPGSMDPGGLEGDCR